MNDLGASSPLVPPLFQSSVYQIADLDTLDQIMEGQEAGFIYARDRHPNAVRLAQKLAELESGDWAVMCSSGMAAISAVILATLQQGDRLVASHRLYGRTTQLFTTGLGRFGIHCSLVDAGNLDEVRRALKSTEKGRAKLLFVETLSNPLLRAVDIPALAELAHQGGALLFVDNTFATPILCRPLELGADVVMESLTKMIGGHSDVTLGVVAGKAEPGNAPGQDPLYLQVCQEVSIWGLSSPPFDCWLAERGLATLNLRMKAACRNAAALAAWLSQQPGVVAVAYPGLPQHPDHQLASRLFDHGLSGNMLCFELKGGRDAVNRFLQNAPGLPFSPSLGHFSTTLSHPASTSHRYSSPKDRQRQGITEGLIRLSVGIEELAEIQAEIARGLSGTEKR